MAFFYVIFLVLAKSQLKWRCPDFGARRLCRFTIACKVDIEAG